MTNCPELESFPRFMLPLSLRELKITNCDKFVVSRMNWNLQLLSNLSSLIIEKYQHEDVESFPEEGLLPTTITVLEISELACLKTLDKKGFGELTCLKRLCIIGCANLETLPKEGLPTCLQHLGILRCPLLEAKCQREKGEYWNKISHIPRPETDIRVLKLCLLEMQVLNFRIRRGHGQKLERFLAFDLVNVVSPSIPDASSLESSHGLLQDRHSFYWFWFDSSRNVFVENVREALDLEAMVKATMKNSNKLIRGTFSTVYMVQPISISRDYGFTRKVQSPAPSHDYQFDQDIMKGTMGLALSKNTLLFHGQWNQMRHFPDLGCPSVWIGSRPYTVINSLHPGRTLPNLAGFTIGNYAFEDIMETFPEQGLLPTTISRLIICELDFLKSLDEKGFQELISLKEPCIHL
ncbi:LRR domain containing protein [Trema orientale]|uniref:LRR domain containing protein n=1 Tax=Trema orientale TaxID=63057 RepID=A0A2P5EN64_TREOI|nr:LRR domain containing protein [Trema orientale]